MARISCRELVMIHESVEMENKIYKEVRNQRVENIAIQMIGRDSIN